MSINIKHQKQNLIAYLLSEVNERESTEWLLDEL